MLLRFSVKNFLSIRDEAELSLVASSLKDKGADLIRGSRPDEILLPAVLIYGANASGKSNLIAAIAVMRWAVLYSHSKGSPSQKLTYSPFLLAPGGSDLPSQFECDFLVQGIRYHFGFSNTAEKFEEEWLYTFPDGKRQLLYFRSANQSKMKFGKNLKGQNRSIEGLMRQNSLFLSTAAQNAHAQLLPLYEFFEKKIELVSSPDVDTTVLQHLLATKPINSNIIEFLRRADTGITSWKTENIEVSETGKKFSAALNALLTETFPTIMETIGDIPDARSKLSLGHSALDDKEVFFDLSAESRGTVRLLSILQSSFSALETGRLFVLDELDASLHTLIAQAVISLFNSSKLNKRGAKRL
jgi:AAA15 family ATPase/GTPase